MEDINSQNPLKEMARNLFNAFSPIYRIEALTGFAGYGLIIDGAIKGNVKEAIAGLVVSALSGAYGAYQDDCFSCTEETLPKSNLENKLK